MLQNLYNEVKEKLVSQTKEFYGDRLVSLVIFGSVARKTQRHDSDIDILIIANNLPDGRLKRAMEFEEIEEKMESLFKELKRKGIHTCLSPVFKTPQEAEEGSPLFLDMVDDAEIVFDKDGFFLKLLERLRNRLSNLGSKRIWRDNCWYWVLKPDYRPKEIFEL